VRRRGAGHTAGGRALTEVVIEVFRLNGRLLAAGDRLVAPFGQSSARWQVLGALMEGPKTVSAAARSMGLTRQSVQRLADRLVEDGLCAYLDNPSHARAPLLSYTHCGEEVLRSINLVQVDWANELARPHEAAELHAAADVLRGLRRRLEGHG